MDRLNRIIQNSDYTGYIAKNKEAEAGRKFCRHDFSHFMDVARIATLLNINEDCGIERELIYAAALLHDAGRFKQYEDKTPHEDAGAALAPSILEQSGFSESEIKIISDAIQNHRNESIKEEKSLRGLLYRADKLSRPCFACEAEKECSWKENKKNMELTI